MEAEQLFSVSKFSASVGSVAIWERDKGASTLEQPLLDAGASDDRYFKSTELVG